MYNNVLGLSPISVYISVSCVCYGPCYLNCTCYNLIYLICFVCVFPGSVIVSSLHVCRFRQIKVCVELCAVHSRSRSYRRNWAIDYSSSRKKWNVRIRFTNVCSPSAKKCTVTTATTIIRNCPESLCAKERVKLFPVASRNLHETAQSRTHVGRREIKEIWDKTKIEQ